MRHFLKSLSIKYEQFLLFLHKYRTGFIIGTEVFMISLLLLGWYMEKKSAFISTVLSSGEESDSGKKKDYIKWVDFTVPADAMTRAFRYDVATCQESCHLNWIELLAYLGAKYGGDFSHYTSADMERLATRLQEGITMEELTKDSKYYSYYKEVYTAVLDGMVGYYEIEIPKSEAPAFALTDTQIYETDPGASGLSSSDQIPTNESEKVWVTKYGLKAFHPLAKNFPYSHYDDFGVSRSYGYRRQHLGHDMMGQTGTPITAAESGTVEAIGWNQYGGWRLGIRSFDTKRYYYYAHLRQNYPYQSNLKEGSIVTAGDVIGYMGRTGYSSKENTNNIDETHLHFGIQLIFDASQKEGNGEIWVDCYQIIKFLSINRSETAKVTGTKEWSRIYQMKDPAVEKQISIMSTGE
ncbi:MAG: M23 family metallopeptidase [Clostridium sp.]